MGGEESSEDMRKTTRMIAKYFIGKFEESDALSASVRANTKEIEIGRIHRLWLKLLRKPVPRQFVFPEIVDTVTFKRPAPYSFNKVTPMDTILATKD